MLFFVSCIKNTDVDNSSKDIISSKDNYLITLSASIENDPNNTKLLFERANYNLENNKLNSALYDLKHCVALDSLNLDAHYLIAYIYFELSKKPNANSDFPNRAMTHLLTIISVDDDYFRAHSLLGELYIIFSNNKEAMYHLNKSLSLEYNQAKTHMLLGYCFKLLNKEIDAVNCFRNAINVDPDYKEAYVQLGQIYHLKKDTLASVSYTHLRAHET